MVHEQKFKYIQVSPERIVLDLESEVMRGPGSIPTRGNIFHWMFLFHIVKPLMALIEFFRLEFYRIYTICRKTIFSHFHFQKF